ncbi:YheC/YheD family protein [Paenibacillus sp. GP183]|jgi:glutathione synthase/RimK-type ligase-like ATP-grasp enzyme|uniref:YheC/YheD family protein n=1 Tax=Paenibacillus sp. GP183 TaxID=1882751 RepID=UPI0008948EB3|nr:YheC/YheD family protein [Paenibacillus sp. GP183]SEC64105.1 YheC/D like ATP-grasp [Paenibacillus sp. GP183]
MRRFVHSKWAKTRAILKDSSSVVEYVPDTSCLNMESLRQMLNKYKMVYIKPNIGTFGKGVMRVEWNETAETPYSYQSGKHINSFVQFEPMFNSISKEIGDRKYLVQKGIDMLKFKGNRFDLRVMVQRTPNQYWESTGIIGRVGDPQKIVTNVHNGGSLQPIEVLLSSYLDNDERKSFIAKLRRLGVQVAKAMRRSYKGIKEIGVDIALDTDLKPWILEVNTLPDPYIFRHLKNKQVFYKIRRYAKFYNRL